MPIHQEAADFYAGRGPDARFIGCITDDGAPEGYDFEGEGGIDAFALFQSTTGEEFGETEFVDEVRNLPAIHADWVHEWDSSEHTPWVYMYDSGTVYVYHFGVEMAQLRCNYTRRAPRREPGPNNTTITHPDEWVRIPRDTARDKFPPMRRAAHAE